MNEQQTCRQLLEKIKNKIAERERLYNGPNATRSFADRLDDDWQEEAQKLKQILNLL